MGTRSERIIVECAENCGNSPKKQLLRDLTVAYAKQDIRFCIEWMTDDVIWEIVGEQRIQGKDNVEKALYASSEREVQQLRIENIITHGDTGSVNGTVQLSGNQTIAFCDVYNFRGFGRTAKIKKITSYNIQTS